MLRLSSSAVVDAWVLERAKAADRRPIGRTVWRFDCRFVFKKRVDKMTAVDGARTAASAGLSVLSGGRAPMLAMKFDEVSGSVEAVDLTSPSVACRSTLVGSD